jgi:hypothetical protein
MGDVQQWQGGAFDLLPSDARRSGRRLSRMSSGRAVREASVEIETDVALTKTSSITTVTGSMMADVTRVAQAQAQFELLVPQASARLNAIADAHAIDLMEQAADHRRALRRI